ncbi:MAG: O-antigen ligase family protein [Bryobacterales bacterium]|nr:O-antigen ligase family protein [Bryobacterales bacterium]
MITPKPKVRTPGAFPATSVKPTGATATGAAMYSQWMALQQNTLRRLALYAGLGFLFLRVSFVHEVLQYLTGINSHLMYLFGPLAIFGALVTQAVSRTFSWRPGLYWLGFAVWMIAAIPTSSWVGGSLTVVLSYLRTVFPLLLVVGGLAMTWRECRLMIATMGAAALINVICGRIFMSQGDARLELAFAGSIGNSNDFAAHLLFALPMLLIVVMRPNRSMLLRFGALAAVGYGGYLIVATASRGALVGVAAAVLCWMVLGTRNQRIALLFALPVAASLIVFDSKGFTLKRITSFTINEDSSEEAMASRVTREYLLRQSIRLTFHHPLFGVGPDQFINAEGKTGGMAGKRSVWQATHNSFTQISSECGLPALLFYLLAIGSTFRLLYRLLRTARRKRHDEMETIAFCSLISLTGYCVASVFLSLGYSFYLLVMSGLAISLSRIAPAELERMKKAALEAKRGSLPGIKRVVQGPLYNSRLAKPRLP